MDVDNESDENKSTELFTKIKKLKAKRAFLRTRINNDDEEESSEEESRSSKIEEMKLKQKLRERPHGVDIVELTVGARADTAVVKDGTDPFKVRTGGMVNMKNTVVTQSDDAYDVGIGTQFSVETNKRDEDDEMMKYIDEQLKNKVAAEKGKEAENSGAGNKWRTPEEAALLAIPTHLRTTASAGNEEMLSNQMLSGIPEVDLGIEVKIKNIEATEEAKLKLLLAERNRTEGPSHFVPTNIAVNFTKKEEEMRRRPDKRRSDEGRSDGSKPEKATDDLHYEKFKKQFRR